MAIHTSAVSTPAHLSSLCIIDSSPTMNAEHSVALETLDVATIRKAFPIFTEHPDTLFFDNAATTQKPLCVVSAIEKFHKSECANAGRGSYSWSNRLTQSVENSRSTVAKLLNADPDLFAFTGGATDSLNMVAMNWGMHNLQDGDEIMVCVDDHQSAVLPWFNLQEILRRSRKTINIVPFTIHSTGTYDRKSLAEGLSERTRIVALTHIHHLYGMEMDIPELKKIIPDSVLLSLDVSQSIGHITIDAKSLGADFISFSGHKMFASNGIGGLWCSRRALADMWPMRVGAKTAMKRSADGLELDRTSLSNLIECGTLNLPGILSLAEAARFMQDIGISKIERHVSHLTKYLVEKLKKLAAIEFAPGIGTCDCTRGYGIVSFRFDHIRSSDMAAYLDGEDILVRTGDHCLARREAVEQDFIRVSLQIYNTVDEIDRFVEVLSDACF